MGELLAVFDGKMSLREVYAREGDDPEEEDFIGTSSKANGNGGDASAPREGLVAARRFNLDGTATGTVMEFLRRRLENGGSGFRAEVSSMAAETES